MSSLRVALKETATSLWVPILVGVSELTCANEKPIGALFEQDKPPNEIYADVVHDELLEPGWETFFSSVLARIAKVVTPQIPEQMVIVPSKLLGAAWHWAITSHQSINVTQSNNHNLRKRDLFSEFFETFIKQPTNFFLKGCGINNGQDNFLKYALSQIGIFSLAGLALKHAPDENLPGVNIDSDDGLGKNLAKGLGYAIVEEVTQGISQSVRYRTDFKAEFGEGKTLWAKALANVINERLVPGHFLSAIGACLSTYFLGKKISRTSAALLGEFPLKILNRIMNSHRRRATKYEIGHKHDDKGRVTDLWYQLDRNGEKIPFYRFNRSTLWNSILSSLDNIFNPLRRSLIRGVSKVFGISEDELVRTFDVKLRDTPKQEDKLQIEKEAPLRHQDTSTITTKP